MSGDNVDENGMIEYFAWYIVKGSCGLDYEMLIDDVNIYKAVTYPDPHPEDEYWVLNM